MLTMSTKKYRFAGIKNGLYVFKRKGKVEYIFVEEARLIDDVTKFVRYFNVIKNKVITEDCDARVL